MANDTINSFIRKIVDTIVEKYVPDKIILFGSYAYDAASEDSDIDLFIIKDTDKKRRVDRFVEVSRIVSDIESDFKIPISPLVLTQEEVRERLNLGDDFIEEILAKGKVLYER